MGQNEEKSHFSQWIQSPKICSSDVPQYILCQHERNIKKKKKSNCILASPTLIESLTCTHNCAERKSSWSAVGKWNFFELQPSCNFTNIYVVKIKSNWKWYQTYILYKKTDGKKNEKEREKSDKNEIENERMCAMNTRIKKKDVVSAFDD